ncbi:hypothetical protein FRUB_02448 [Fimbriiglobus ruber]|uniref:Uncharacterized protein n=2 Tax=Fimbriiglobus ruber TaxID=1908690 RepID=A0A225E362_9BACT|nr:hypothetical protein FRUB_02448 [Fimbriiglobus ruber]
MGVVKEDGSFELVCGSAGKGAPPGEYDVLVEWTRVTGRGTSRPQTGRDVLNGRYADPKRPLLHATVGANGTNPTSFELTDAGVIPTRPR